jgi:hypothetical protein
VAAKPRSQWSAAYRKRVESAERRGQTRQQARGHGSAAREGRSEAQQRRERRISRLIEQTEVPEKREQTTGEVYAELTEIMRGNQAAMLRYLNKLRELMVEYREYGPGVDDLLDELHDITDEYEMDGSWFYYH